MDRVCPTGQAMVVNKKGRFQHMKVTRIELQPGVWLTAVQTKKFKSSVLGAQFLTPLTAEDASRNALVPMVLRRGTAKHPDMESLSAALDELYGGSLEPMVRKKGETQCVGFVGSFLDDAYTLNAEQVLEPAAALLAELIGAPYTVDGAFCPDYTRQEKANLIDRIKAQVNDKRPYAQIRVVAEMCAGEPFGVDKLGSEAAVEAIDPKTLWEGYQALLKGARVELYYCGSAEAERVQKAFQPLVDLLPEGKRAALARPAKQKAPKKPNRVEEALDVTQGKLAMGLRTNCDAWDEQYPALMLVNAIYGGTTTSKLFMNVRSGVEFDKVGQAEAEILSQLYKCQTGDFSDDELEWARRSVVSTLRTTLDTQARLEDYWLGHSAAGLTEDPDQVARKVEAVTRAQVVEAAQDLTLDTVYFLKGRE